MHPFCPTEPLLQWTQQKLPYYSIFTADTLLYAVTLTFDHEHLQCITCDVEILYQIWTQSRNLRQSYCDFNIWPYDLEHVLRVALGSRITVTKFDLPQLTRAWIIAFFDANTLCHAVALTYDLLTLNFESTSGVMRLNSVQNLSEIK